MKSKNFNPESLYQKLQQATNAVDQKHFHNHAQEVHHVKIRPNKDVGLGKFRPDPLIPGGYIAHPTTISAMRKDIFAAGEEVFEDLEYWIHCEKCNTALDVQFWIFCPYCEAHFPSPLPSPLKSDEM